MRGEHFYPRAWLSGVHRVYTRKNLTTCQQDVFATGLQQACQQVVTMLLFYQVATRLSLTTC
jgi:hypothetical protein